MVLGIDISTSITGFAVVAEGQLVFYDSIDLRKHKNIFDKTIAIKENFLICMKCINVTTKLAFDWEVQSIPIEHIYIEQSLHMFMGGKSSAKTLSTLTRFNGIVSWLVFELFEIKTRNFIGATSARKQAGIKVPRGKKQNK